MQIKKLVSDILERSTRFHGPTQRDERNSSPSSNHPVINFNTGDGMQSTIFGPLIWMTIHITSFNYPPRPSDKDRTVYSNWLWSIGQTLPCKSCRDHFTSNMEAAGFNDSSMDSRDAFSRFCYRLHCVVNDMLGKTSPPYNEVRLLYESFRAKCINTERQGREKKGCIRPKHAGVRGQCIVHIVPHEQSENDTHIVVNPSCNLKK